MIPISFIVTYIFKVDNVTISYEIVSIRTADNIIIMEVMIHIYYHLLILANILFITTSLSCLLKKIKYVIIPHNTTETEHEINKLSQLSQLIVIKKIGGTVKMPVRIMGIKTSFI